MINDNLKYCSHSDYKSLKHYFYQYKSFDFHLNDQDGFDPDGSAWTCTECGETLYGGDMESTMENYIGVVWYCDSCNAILNKQSGFDDSLPYWDCTECGHRNEISEDQIYESQEDYENSKKQYTCPNCEANLNDQYLFDED